jgi:hypothetical protein
MHNTLSPRAAALSLASYLSVLMLFATTLIVHYARP